MRNLEESGRRPPCAEQVFAVVDHVIDSAPGRSPSQSHLAAGSELIESVRQRAPQFGITFFDVTHPRQGIVHVISPELAIALPGTTLVCADSHTCTVGGVGALAWGVGSSESEHVLATQTLTQTKPKTMRIDFEGPLDAGVYPKDMILHLIGTIGVNGGIGYAVEFAGSTIRNMQLEGGMPIEGVAIAAAYIGSCTNARLSDLRAAAAVLKGRKVAAGVQAICVPGSTQVKADAEAELCAVAYGGDM